MDTKKKGPAPLTREAAEAAVNEALAHLDQAFALLRPVTVSLTTDERRTSPGRLRLGEAAVLRTVVEAAAANPALVAGHTELDGGRDPDRFETELLTEWFGLHEVFAAGAQEAQARAERITSLLNDSAMHHGARARRPSLRVYKDLSTLAQSNVALRTSLHEAMTYYGDVARKAQRTVRARKKG